MRHMKAPLKHRLIAQASLGIPTVLIWMYLFCMTSCGPDKYVPDPSIHYINEKATIIAFGSQHQGKSDSKMVIVQLCSDTTMKMELIQHVYESPEFTDEKYYNWKLCDTVRFDYIRKARFFKTGKITHQ